jgi:hypothetical protein
MKNVHRILQLRPKNFYSIPIYIISYNRKNDLELLVNRLMNDGYKNINIIDNASKNIELLDYLKDVRKQGVKVFYMEHNYGHRVFWESHLFDDVIHNQYYVLTDPDVIPIDECPANYVEVFFDILQKYPDKIKVGFSLKIDDLPESYIYKYKIIRFESFYWEKILPYKFKIYDAPIDTTFALYRPVDKELDINFYDGIRTGEKYIARHLGWYENNAIEEHYLSQDNISSTSLNKEAMEHFDIATIKRILENENLDTSFFNMSRMIFSLEYLKKYSIADILLGDVYLFLKKVKSYFK